MYIEYYASSSALYIAAAYHLSWPLTSQVWSALIFLIADILFQRPILPSIGWPSSEDIRYPCRMAHSLLRAKASEKPYLTAFSCSGVLLRMKVGSSRPISDEAELGQREASWDNVRSENGLCGPVLVDREGTRRASAGRRR